MCLVFTVLAAFAIGFLVKARPAAVSLYLALFAFVFTLQSLNLLMDWLSGSDEAFGPAPTDLPADYAPADLVGYGVVNAVIGLVGVGLVLLGTRVASKRSAKRHQVSVA